MAVSPIYVHGSTAGDHEVFEDTDWELQDLVRLELQWASSFGSAVRGSEEAVWWLLSQLLRYSFCGICGNELEGLALVARGQKSLFPCWPILHTLFCSHIYWCGDTQKGHLGWCSSFYD